MSKEIFCKECDDCHYEGQLCHTQKDVWEKHNSSLTLAELKKLLPKAFTSLNPNEFINKK